MNESIPAEDRIPVPGVHGLDHTADIGLEVMAQDLPELFARAALATLWLVLGRPTVGGPADEAEGAVFERGIELAEADLATLFRSWLRTVLLWEDSEGFVLSGSRLMLLPTPLCGAPDGQAFGLKGNVEGYIDEGPRVREIKGVTLHGLAVERSDGGWKGTVIFDV
jgi:SHS2 domain-containing protein